MIKAHKIRLHPNTEQLTYFAKAAGTARFVFNWGLAEWKRQYEAGEKPSTFSLKKAFNALKEEQFPWIYEVSKSAVEGHSKIWRGVQEFFRRLESWQKGRLSEVQSQKA
jgi:transposase